MGITKQMHIEEAYRDDKAEERLSESIARDDDVGFNESDFINLELIEAGEKIQQKISKGEE